MPASLAARARLFLPAHGFILPFGMKLADVYRDWRIMAGLALILLGAGNWIVGLEKTEESSRMIAAATRVLPSGDYRSFDELDAGADSAVLRPFVQQEERVSYATARMDFYHVTFLTGQIVTVAGVILTFLGFITVIQRDARRTLKRFSETAAAPKIRIRDQQR
jgi:hypothetical protein